MNQIRLFEYKRWANERLFGKVKTLPSEAISAPELIVFGSLINTLNHVLTVDLIFKSHLAGEAHGFTTRRPAQSPPLSELWSDQSDVDAWYLQYARTHSGADHDEIIEFEFVDGGSGAMSRGDILLHIVNHGTYHRGHIGTMLYNMSVEPPTTDYTVFLRDAVH